MQVAKLERQVGRLQEELVSFENKYDCLHEKYLDERRQFENELLTLQDKYSQDI